MINFDEFKNNGTGNVGRVLRLLMRDDSGHWALAELYCRQDADPATVQMPKAVEDSMNLTFAYVIGHRIVKSSGNTTPWDSLVTFEKFLASLITQDGTRVVHAVPELEPGNFIVGYSGENGFLVGRKANRPWMEDLQPGTGTIDDLLPKNQTDEEIEVDVVKSLDAMKGEFSQPEDSQPLVTGFNVYDREHNFLYTL